MGPCGFYSLFSFSVFMSEPSSLSNWISPSSLLIILCCTCGFILLEPYINHIPVISRCESMGGHCLALRAVNSQRGHLNLLKCAVELEQTFSVFSSSFRSSSSPPKTQARSITASCRLHSASSGKRAWSPSGRAMFLLSCFQLATEPFR